MLGSNVCFRPKADTRVFSDTVSSKRLSLELLVAPMFAVACEQAGERSRALAVSEQRPAVLKS